MAVNFSLAPEYLQLHRHDGLLSPHLGGVHRACIALHSSMVPHNQSLPSGRVRAAHVAHTARSAPAATGGGVRFSRPHGGRGSGAASGSMSARRAGPGSPVMASASVRTADSHGSATELPAEQQCSVP